MPTVIRSLAADWPAVPRARDGTIVGTQHAELAATTLVFRKLRREVLR